MSFVPVEPRYEDYVRLANSLLRDGQPVALADLQEGDFVYLSDGPRIITELGELHPARESVTGNFSAFRSVGVCDTGGPITGGWMTLYEPGEGRHAHRGGHDHFRARVDYAESQLRRWQRARGRRHPA